MADDLIIDEGTSAKKAATDEVTSNRHVPWVKLMSGVDNATAGAPVDGTNGLKVDVSNTSITGSAGAPNAGVLSVQGITSMIPLQAAFTVANCIQWTNFSQEYTTAQTSADMVALSGTMKFYIGRITIAAGYVASATTCTVKVYLGTSAYAAGTDQLVFGGEFSTIPGTGLVSYPGVIIGNGAAPFTISAAGDALKITTVASTHPRIYVSVDYIRV